MNDNREPQPPLEPWQRLLLLLIRCERHRQTPDHRCALHDELDRRIP